MRISLNWLSDFIDIAPIRADLRGVLGKLSMRGLVVEYIEELSKGFDKVVIAQIETRDRHPNADRLSVCRVNNGTEVLQIVCGAQNMKAGDKVALSMIGALLPNGMKIEKGKIRDVESFGMLCSETELGLAEESAGILILPPDAPVGKPLAPFIGRDDITFEVDVTPNRGDALSHLGVARELAALLGQKLKVPGAKFSEAGTAAADKIKVTLHNPPEAPDLCLQYHGRYIEGVKVGPSPAWLQRRLVAVGLRPINNIVDVTNYVLMEHGQPLHAFDYSQVKGSHIHVRLAKAGEKMPLLDGTNITLDAQDLVIADTERPVALAGVMGGANSEVTDRTTSILLEAAQFSPTSVRQSGRRHQKSTDSSQRFERHIDAANVAIARDRAVQLILETAGGKAFKGAVSAFSPKGQKLARGEGFSREVKISFINHFLGVALTSSQVIECLSEVGFSAKVADDHLTVKAPSYRAELVENLLPEDISEEVLRVWGYDKVPLVVPQLNAIPDPANAVELRARKIDKLKLALVEHGFSEAVNYAFTSEAFNARWGGPEASRSVKLHNPLNEEFTTLKTSLVGGLLTNLVAAVRFQQSSIRLFEVRPVFTRDEKSETGVAEEWRVCGVLSGRGYGQALRARDRELDFYDAKGVLEVALDTLGVRGYRYSEWEKGQADSRLHPAQSARLAIGRGPCGFVGRLHPRIEAEFKLREPVFVFEFSLDRALEVAKGDRKISAASRFPKVDRDLSLLVPREMPSEKITQAIQKLGKPTLESVTVVDIYSGDKIPADKLSLSVALLFGDPARTLSDGEVDALVQKILTGLDRECGVKLRLQ